MINFNNNQILQRFKSFLELFKSNEDVNINQVTFTSVDNLNAGILNDTNEQTTTQGLNYPLVNCFLQNASISTNQLSIDFELSYFDRLMKDGSNLVPIWDDSIVALAYILRTLELNRAFIFKNEESQLEFFKYDLDDECAGAKVMINVKFDISVCGKIVK